MYNPNENQQPWPYQTPPDYPLPQPEPVPEEPQKNKRSVGVGKVILIAACFSLVGAILGTIGGAAVASIVGGVFSKDPSNQHTGNQSATLQEGQREDSTIDINEIDTSKLMTPAEVYAANVNSTVGITTSITTNLWGYQTTEAASGSGFIISKTGYILTNFHVIEDSDTITVSFYDGTSAEAQLLGYDSSNDIAVLKVEAEDLTPVTLGDSDKLNVGDSVAAIGNPLGELTFSLTVGTVSAKDRTITTSTGVTMNLMQTDCAINSGNSGGALFNMYGEVIGITNAKYSSSGSDVSVDNIGFAIPMNQVRSIVESIIQNGYYAKPYIGVQLTDVSEESQSYGLPQGAAVKLVVEDSPAEAAGLQVNDIITKIGEQKITGSSDVVSIISKCEAGQELKLTVYRQGQTLELTLIVSEQIQGQEQQGSSQQQQQQQSPQYQIPEIPGFSDLFPFFNFG